jgi:REP element-mobilizing transposase RayT
LRFQSELSSRFRYQIPPQGSNVMLERLKEIFIATVSKWQCELVEFNGESDHVHLLLSLNPKVCLSSFVNNIKYVFKSIFEISVRIIQSQFFQILVKEKFLFYLVKKEFISLIKVRAEFCIYTQQGVSFGK